MSNNPVINTDIAPRNHSQHGTRFDAEMASFSSALGMKKLGCRITVVPPGKRAWPFHSHHANEELFYVIEGTGIYRFGEETYPIEAGCLLAAPTGGAEHAHQIINDSTAPLKYLAVSTMLEPDIMEYPDSGKFGAFAGAAPGGAKDQRTFEAFAATSATIDYWSNET